MTCPIRTVLVHLDPTEGTPQRLVVAREVAARLGAELSALYAVLPAYVGAAYAIEVAVTAVDSLAILDNARRDQVLSDFDREMAKPGPVAAWAQTDDLPTALAFARQAFYADLLVLGQRNPEDAAALAVPPDFVESVLVASGRPAIVVPYIGHSLGGVGNTVAIAWKETPEAARAVLASIPLLQRASRVHVFAWSEGGAPRMGGRPLDIKQYLLAHGIDATWHHEGDETPRIGEQLLSRACDVGADLLVMGCYGHGHAREGILGGASRTILHSMTLPVLMAH